ncbi:MAG: YhfC family glutamic-type intramembrane protease [Polyangiales bacterium]
MDHDAVVIGTSIAQAVLMVALPIVVAVVAVRRGLPKWMIAVGAATFLGSQVVHLPMNVVITMIGAKLGLNETLSGPSALVVNALVLGLTAAFCEEGARFLVFRWTFARRKEWRSPGGALAHGLGHGGFEAMALGALVAVQIVGMLSLRDVDLSRMPMPDDQRALAMRQVAEYWAMPAWLPFVGVLERVLTMCLHAALSVSVAYGVATRRFRPVWLAFLAHWSVDAFAVLAVGGVPMLAGDETRATSYAGILATEAALAVVALVSLRFLKASWSLRFSPQDEATPPPATPDAEAPATE